MKYESYRNQKKEFMNELLESESNREHDKLNRVDLLVKNTQDELILIEIRNDSASE